MPDVSVVIPTHDRARFLEQAIDSVLAQTGCDIEVIVVDDASTDETAHILKNYGRKIHPIVLPSNVERGAARNIGASYASAPRLAFLDSDDVWMPNKLRNQISHVRRLVVCMTGVQRITANGTPRGRALIPTETSTADVGLYNPFPAAPSSLVLEKALFQRAGGFVEDVHLQGSEDWLLLMQLFLGLNCRVHVVPEPLVHYREHGSNSIADPKNVARSMWGAVHRAIEDGLITKQQSALSLARTAETLARQFAYHGDGASRSKWLADAVKDASTWQTFRSYGRVSLSASKGRFDRLVHRLPGVTG